MILCKDFQYMYSLPRNGAEQVWLFALRKLGNKVSKKTDLNIFSGIDSKCSFVFLIFFLVKAF